MKRVDVLIPNYRRKKRPVGPTTVKDRRYNATELFGTLIQEYEQASLAVEV